METISFVEKAKGFLINPVETYKKVKDEPLGVGFRYYIILMVLYAALNAIVIGVLWNTFWGSLFSVFKNIPGLGVLFGSPVLIVITLFLLFLIMGVIGIFLSGGIVHLGVLMFGGKRGYIQTVKAVMYAETPALIFGWIPIAGAAMSIWTLILDIFGVKELQEMSIGKAILAILVPILIIIGIITILVAFTVFVYVGGMMRSPGI